MALRPKISSLNGKHMVPCISNRNRLFTRAKSDSTLRYNIEIRRENHIYTVEQLNKAPEIIIIEVQRDDFKDEVHQIQHHGRVDQKSRLNDLSPFLDTKEIDDDE